MKRFEASGMSLLVPIGWEARLTSPNVRRRDQVGIEQPYLHASNFPLPVRRAPYGGGVVQLMAASDVFVALVEYERSSAPTALFAQRRIPARLQRGDFSSASVQRALRGQSGVQRFFHVDGRAFCLYVVVGGQPAFRVGLTDLNFLLRSLRINATAGAV